MSFGHQRLDHSIEQHLLEWFEQYKIEAESGENIDSKIQLSRILLRGSRSIEKDVPQAIYWLNKASKKSAEASFYLAKIYGKGKHVPVNCERAYFFYRKAMHLKRCECADYKEAFHSKNLSLAQPCYYYESEKAISVLPISAELVEQYESQFKIWRESESS